MKKCENCGKRPYPATSIFDFGAFRWCMVCLGAGIQMNHAYIDYLEAKRRGKTAIEHLKDLGVLTKLSNLKQEPKR